MKRQITGFRSIKDETVKEKTGKSTKQWHSILDKWNAVDKGHTKTARYLREKYDLDPWWAQAVTIRHEWDRGVKG